MGNINTNIVAGLLGLIALTSAGAAWSSDSLPAENRLDPSYYDVTHFPTIDFTDINLFYVPSVTNSRSRNRHRLQNDHRLWSRYQSLGANGNFMARNSFESTFTLNGPGYDGTSFDGYFLLSAKISENGTLEDGRFSFMSSDELFGFGTKTVCRRNGRWCKERDVIGEVFGGTLSDLGWSNSESFIEFQTTDFRGWACDMGWCTISERLWFNVDGDSLGFTGENHLWRAMADGTAVIPVPAAVWLFGSGLITLLGFSARKKAS